MDLSGDLFLGGYPLKISISPENGWMLEDEISFPKMVLFQGRLIQNWRSNRFFGLELNANKGSCICFFLPILPKKEFGFFNFLDLFLEMDKT